jgi:hypothetical protein
METLQRTANRGSVSTGYDIDNSLKFESANTESLTKSQTDSNKKTWTLSFWFKKTKVDSDLQYVYHYNVSSGNEFYFLINGTSDYRIEEYNSGAQIRFHSGGSGDSFRDPSAWYHMVIACDTTQSTEANRFKIYKNGVDVTAISGYFSTAQYPSQDYETRINNSAATISVGKSISASTNFCGYMAEVNFIDGLMKDEEDFGEFDSDTGIWIPKQYTGSYGNEGYYLDFADSANLGDDASGNGKNFTENNITAADQATDTCTNNFCTINPLIPYYGSVSEGATKWLHTSGGSGWEAFVATIGAGTSGKWYAEFKVVTSGSADNILGICPIDDPDLNRGADHFPYYGSDTSLDESVGYYAANGQRYIGGGGAGYGNSWASTNIMSIAVDMDNGKLYFAKDGVWQNSGNPTSGATGTGALDVRGATKPQSLGASNYTSGENILANYGGYTTISISSAASDENGYGSFEYAPPSGYYALCTKNLAEYG